MPPKVVGAERCENEAAVTARDRIPPNLGCLAAARALHVSHPQHCRPQQPRQELYDA